LTPSALSSPAPAGVRINTTESLFGGHFKRLLQQNRPTTDSRTAKIGVERKEKAGLAAVSPKFN
jgi:hypothetical protein